MKDTGSKEERMGWGSLFRWMGRGRKAQPTKANGPTAKSKATATKPGPTAPNTRANTKMTKNTDMAFCIWLTGHSIKDSSTWASSKEKVLTYGKVKSSIRGSGMRAK